MRELIPSKYVRDYYREHNITLTDWQRAALICDWHRELIPWSEKRAELREISESTLDEELKTEIETYIALNDELIEKLKADSSDTVYRGNYSDIFSSFDKAWEAGV